MVASNLVSVDFSNVKESSGVNPKHKPEGEYRLRVTKAELGKAKSGDPMVTFLMQSVDDRSAVYPYYCPLSESSLWKFRTVLISLGLPVPKKKGQVNLSKTIGLELGVGLEDDEYDGKMKSVIMNTFPADELDAIDSDGSDEDEGDEEDEDDEEEAPAPKAKKRKPAPVVEEEDDEEEDEEEEPAPVKKKAKKKPAPVVEEEDEDEEEDDEEEEEAPPVKKVSARTLKRRAEKAAAEKAAAEEEDDEDEEEEEAPAPKKKAKKKAKPVVEEDDDEDLDLDDI